MSNHGGNGAGPLTPPATPGPTVPATPIEPASSEVGATTAHSTIAGRHHKPALEESDNLELDGRINEHRARKTELNLRRAFGYGLLGAVVLKIALADTVFLIYAANNDWRIDGTTLQVWLGATVVEVIGLAGVVVKYLFSSDAAPR